jgi:N-acetyl-anhydromuramyl-L-alanine amidase AmpD
MTPKIYKNPNLKPLDRSKVKLLVIHCVANKCTREFKPENLIACGIAKFGQPSYHYYIRYTGEIVPILPENVRGAHARRYNSCSLGIVYEGGLDANGKADDTRTEAQKKAMEALLKDLTEEYPDARIVGHCELPYVTKSCPNFIPSKEYASLQPENRNTSISINK